MIFVGTGAFVARHIRRDQHHEEATRVWRELARSGERCVTSSFVVDEALTLIGRRTGNQFAAAVGRQLCSSRLLEILSPGREDEIAALGLLEKYADQSVTFTDCVCFVLMRSRRLDRVFGFDSDFRIAGFQLVPGSTSRT